MDFLDEIKARIDAAKHPPRDLSNHGFGCAVCGETHSGLMDLGCDAPDVYQSAGEDERETQFAKTDDLCVWKDEHFFVRCVLPIPIHGLDQFFAYGVWSSLSKTNFELYRDHWDHPARDGLGPWFGWLSNALKSHPGALNLPCRVHPQDDGQRPLLEIEPGDHPLAAEQRDGITVERLMEVYAANGHGPA